MKTFYSATLRSVSCSLALFGTLMLSVGTATADVQVQGVEESAEPVKKKKLSRKERNKRDGLECKRVRETGSRVSKKVCTTSAQRKASLRRERDKVNALEDRAILTSPSAN